jgi:hypothetical protein
MIRLVALLALLPGVAAADAGRCVLDLVKAVAKQSQAAEKVIARCRDRVLAGRLPASTDCGADPALAGSAAKLHAAVAKACCGGDGTCGTADDVALSAVGWTATTCPDFESLGCNAPIATPDDVATCLACIGTAAPEALTMLPPGAPAAAGTACRRAIGKEIARYFRATSHALARCWAARARGAHANPCPDPGDGAARPAIDRARAVAESRICRACGGADGQCGGSDDVSLAAIGGIDRCPAVTVPGGAGCDATIGDVSGLVACLACMTDFSTACVTTLAVPAFAPYPASCDPPPGTCAPGVTCETFLDCPAGYTCRDNGSPTRYCVGPACTVDADCGGGGVCRQYCTTAGCGPRVCQCPGFGCTGPNQLCIDDGGLACRLLCTQDSDCVDPFGFVCVNPGFGFGVCIGQTACQ